MEKDAKGKKGRHLGRRDKKMLKIKEITVQMERTRGGKN